MLKVAILGPASRRRESLEALQAFGFLHVDRLEQALRREARTRPQGAESAHAALRYLSSTPRIRTQITSDPSFDVGRFIEAVLANRDARRTLLDHRDLLDKRIAQVRPFGDFAFPDDLDEIGGQRLWFYICPLRSLEKFSALKRPWVELHRQGGQVYVVVLGPDEPPETLGGATRSHVGARRLSDLLSERAALDVELDELDAARESLTRRIGLLVRDRASAEDDSLLGMAEELARDEGGWFILRGWAPARRRKELMLCAEQAGVAIVLSEPARTDNPPTLLRPAGLVAAGGDLLKLYQLPGPRDWDPSGFVYVSFAFFFALIVSDAGYSAILLALCLLFWRRMGRGRLGLRLRGLFLAATVLGVIWGVCVGSYFGNLPPAGTWLADAHRLSLDDYEQMMQLSVCVGAAHVALANLAAAWASRRRFDALARLGWVAIIVGGMAYWLAGDRFGRAPWWIMGGGAACILLFSGGVLKGLTALTGVSRVLSDILSYLRLFALGLAGSSLAIAFNTIAAGVREASPGFGLFASLLILAIGHALNLTLTVMGGVVHGLRLNFIEFLGWSLSEEGRPFIPFAKHMDAAR